jgi:hypothetical protein
VAERPLNVAWSSAYCLVRPAESAGTRAHGPFPQWTEPPSRGRCPFFRWLPQVCRIRGVQHRVEPAVTALKNGIVDGWSRVEPAASTIEQGGDGTVLYDTRTEQGTRDVFGGA